MIEISPKEYFELIINFENIPYRQSKGMFESFQSVSSQMRCFVDNKEAPQLACFGHIKRFLHLEMLAIEDFCSKDHFIGSKKIKDFLFALRNHSFDIIEFSSDIPYSFETEVGFRQAGFLRPVGQFSMPITKIIDLTSPLKYNQNWKRNLRKASQNNLEFEIIQNLTKQDCTDFVSLYSEMNNRKSLSHHLTVNQIYNLCCSENFSLAFVSHEGKRICGIIIHHFANHAGLFYAATNKEALTLSSSFFMYESLLLHLKDKGFTSFDVEKLVPSTSSVNSVFLFKNGIVGEYVVLNGEWSWYKKSYYRPLMYFVKKYLMKKREL